MNGARGTGGAGGGGAGSPDGLDVALGGWLAEGPRRAPDPPVAAAIAHARRNPRRRDPLLFLRPDPMGRRAAFAAGLQPAFALLALGLLLAAVAGVAVVGSRPPDMEAPVPTSAATTPPAATPTPSPAPTPFEVTLEVAAGQPATVTVTDLTGALAGARSGTPDPNGPRIGDGEIALSAASPTELELHWMGLACPSAYDMAIGGDAATGLELTLTIAPCTGDTDLAPLDRALVLEFVEAVDVEDVVTRVEGSLLPPG